MLEFLALTSIAGDVTELPLVDSAGCSDCLGSDANDADDDGADDDDADNDDADNDDADDDDADDCCCL